MQTVVYDREGFFKYVNGVKTPFGWEICETQFGYGLVANEQNGTHHYPFKYDTREEAQSVVELLHNFFN